ncbi:MAG: RNA polymerase sigma factor [Desulfomonile tiedjei]|uniref:RNA polymerase sigma factor n=1 Tax=Desulfomonile tiedjei TaxID=2358 RepID=A0A9D6V1X0_9BACT|nr:RNA polymerase sigma factor [Desulfomonile tiedjei]
MKADNKKTDEELALAARNGSEAAFSELVDRYASTLYSVGYGVTTSPQEAEDIVQETFFKAFKHIDSFSPEKASFKTWLITIARNQSINVFSSLKRKALRFFDQDEDQIQDSAHADYPFQAQQDPETQLAVKQEFRRVELALKKLPERQRTAILLKSQENLSYDEIAVIMGASASSVESLIFRARRKLMQILED